MHVFIAKSNRTAVSKKSTINNTKVRSFASDASFKKTALHPLHLELGAKMVEFCGWDMPIQYPDGILNSHLHCRQGASLFDVSHMAQLKVTGKDRVKFFESLCVADIEGLTPGSATLSVYTTPTGGIIDDTIITKHDDHLFVVVNAGCADKDIAHITKQIKEAQSNKMDVKFEQIDRSLIALQGPKAEKVVSSLCSAIDFNNMGFMTSIYAKVGGFDCLVSRCGYTGEDGFEISVAHKDAIALAKKMLASPDVKAAGLGPRDSLRLEAGLCLYGHDISDEITPVEASLAWTIGKRRRETGGFPGDKIILGQLKDPSLIRQKRLGFFIEGPPAREGAPIVNKEGAKVGHITSGTLSPILKKSVAMGYLYKPFYEAAAAKDLSVEVRGKKYPASLTKMPFVPTTYKKLPKK